MDNVRTWALSLCVALVAGGVCHLLLPNKSMEKIFQLVASSFFLCCVLAPFLSGALPLLEDLEVEIPQDAMPALENLNGTVDQQVLALTEQRLEDQLGDHLRAHEIVPLEIDVSIHAQEDHSIRLDQIAVTVSKEQTPNAGTIRFLTEELLGMEPAVYYQQEETS